MDYFKGKTRDDFSFKLSSNDLKSKIIIQTFSLMASCCRDKCYFLCLETCLSFCNSVLIQWTFLPILIQQTVPAPHLTKFNHVVETYTRTWCVSHKKIALCSVLPCSFLVFILKEGLLFIACLLLWSQPFWSRPFLLFLYFFALLSSSQLSETNFVFWHP